MNKKNTNLYDKLILDLNNYFINLDTPYFKNKKSRISCHFAYNSFLIIVGSVKFEIVIYNLSRNNVNFEINLHAGKIEKPPENNFLYDYSLPSKVGFYYLNNVFEALMGKNLYFKKKLAEILNEYQLVLPPEVIKLYNSINTSLLTPIEKPPQLKWYVFVNKISESYSLYRSPGKDSRTTTETEIKFLVKPVNENFDSNELNMLQNHLNNFTLNFHENDSDAYVPFHNKIHRDIKENFDLDLTCYINNLAKTSNQILSTPPINKYESNYSYIIHNDDIIFGNLKVILFFIFSTDKSLNNITFRDYNLLYLLITLDLSKIKFRDPINFESIKTFYLKIIKNMKFSISGSVKINNFLESYFTKEKLNENLINYYCKNSNIIHPSLNLDLYNINSIYTHFRHFFK